MGAPRTRAAKRERGDGVPAMMDGPHWTVVPAYFHPAVAAGDWARLAAAGSAVGAVVFNVDSGPGDQPEPELATVAGRLAVPLLGYIDLDYGRRPAAEVARDLARHRAWYPVAGFFLDRVGSARRELPFCAGVVAEARRQGAATVVLNHGTYPDPAFATIGDALVTFEGSAAAHAQVTAPGWVRQHPADRFWHLVYDTPAERVAAVVQRSARLHARAAYVTDRGGANPWDGLPAYFLGGSEVAR